MKQIIKFRAWDGLNKKFTYWTMNDLCAWGDDKEKPSALDSWQQFTGLTDRNGKEIYEGDLFMDEEDGTYNFVEWDDVFGGWGTNQWFLPAELVEQAPTLEIIGNIYETELK